jgi:ParB family chromosome partitioning protein
MATATQKITLSTSRDIPFNKLVLSQSNIRRVKAGVSIEELAEDIARRGLLQSLNVRPVLDGEGNETGMFEIPAGGRRYRALELLTTKKRLAKTVPVPCVVREAGTDIPAEEDSLAENVQRVALHPLDQFRAFQALRERGLTEEEIAARFFVSVNVVKQRLRLVTVSQTLLDTYAEDGITLEQLMAFTVSTDHVRQQQVWEAIQHSWSKEPYQIRRMLTENTVRASDRRVQFVTLAAYEQAGGIVMRDLFQDDDGGWVEDVPLLERLVADRLKAEAEAIAREGWKWIEVAADFPYGHTNGLRALAGTPVDLTDEERDTREALRDELERLEAEYTEADELPDELDERLGKIEAELDAFEDRSVHYDAADASRAGAFVSIGHDGRLAVERGYVRPEDEVPEGELDGERDPDGEARTGAGDVVQRTVITVGGEPEAQEDEDAVRPLPERLVTELTAHRTLALRDALADNPHVAMTALLHRLVRDTFQHVSAPGCLEASVRHVFFPIQAADLKDSASAKAIAERQEAWKADLPGDDDALWDRIDGLDEASRMALLAHCVSFGVNALYERGDRYGAGPTAHGVRQRISEADRLARAVSLDMVEAGWRPTVDNYLGRVTKPRILEAVREAKGAETAQLIDHLKKPEMAKEAERLLADSGWLPDPLRLPPVNDQPADGDAGDTDALPAFLADDEDTEDEAVGDTTSGAGDTAQVHVLVKPTRPDISTNLVINTDRRTYLVELRSGETPYMPSIAWSYPRSRTTRVPAVQAAPIIPPAAQRNYRYALGGDRPPWRPVAVYDDGRRVYVEFPRGIVQGEMPPLFVIGPDGEPELVNSRVHGNILIVDRLFAAAELRLGAEDQQRVRIIRTDGVRRGPLQRMRSSGGASQATNARSHSGGQR